MGNRGNWYQQNLSRIVAPRDVPGAGSSLDTKQATTKPTTTHCYRPSRPIANNYTPPGVINHGKHGVFTHHVSPSIRDSSRVGPLQANCTKTGARSASEVNATMQRNAAFRRSWPSQSRQSTLNQGVSRYQVTMPANIHVNHPLSRQFQTPQHGQIHHGIRRAQTWADFAGRATTTSQSHHRIHFDSSVGALPKVDHRQPGTIRGGTPFSIPIGSSGLHERTSALRSLASNPLLKVETLNGATRIFRTSNRRPRSLPAKFSESPHSDNPSLDEFALGEPREKIIYVSKHGYHPRSHSPTYPTLIGTKDTLNLALCKKLWIIRRDLEGRKARENSVVCDSISQALVNERHTTEKWYEQMFDEHEQDDDDHDMAVVERLRSGNTDNKYAQLNESISTAHPRPHVDLLFDRHYLREHINDWDILGIDIEEEELKTEQRIKKASVARPSSGENGRKSRFPVQTVTKTKRISKPTNNKVNSTTTKTNGKTRSDERTTRLPAVSTTGRLLDSRKKRGKKAKKAMIPSHEDENDNLPEVPTADGNSIIRTPSPPLQTILPLTQESRSNSELDAEKIELDDMDRRKSLISKYLRSPQPTNETSPTETEIENDEAIEKPEAVQNPEGEEEEKPKELTEKEKFTLMRKRMDDRKAVMQKRREDFMDYSMLGIKSQRRRNDTLGATSSTKNSLGSLMSTRLESMATFKTRKYRGEEIDDDDEDDDDEDDDDDGDDDEEDDDEDDSKSEIDNS